MYNWKITQVGETKSQPVLEAMIEVARCLDYQDFALESIGRYVVDQYEKGYTMLQLR